jgi:transcription elongation factor Elf1
VFWVVGGRGEKLFQRRLLEYQRYLSVPRCSSRALTIVIKKKNESRAYAIVSCGSCGLYDDEDFQDIPVVYQPIDVYAKFIDLFNTGVARIKEVKGGEEGGGEGS